MFDLDDIVSAEHPHDVMPISYDKIDLPFDGSIGGAVFDDDNSVLYINVEGAGQVGKYDRPPITIAYKINLKQG